MIILRSTVLVLMMALIAAPFSALALTDEFIVSQVVTESADATPPSIPQNLTAIATGQSEIDLSWDASTDNVGVAGYHIFRDSVLIADVPGTSYTDSGLTPATTYTYTVRAYDPTGNESADSNAASATTDPADDGGGGGPTGSHPDTLKIIGLSVVPSTEGAIVTWRTNRQARSVLSWGETGAYELGSLAEGTFSSQHSTRLTELEPGTTYRVFVTATDRNGFEAEAEIRFSTIDLRDTTPPANVSDLTGVPENGDDVRLTWQNPEDADFDHVIIVRSFEGYPHDPSDGTLVYEGDNETFLDEDTLKDHDHAFYAVFAYDEAGNGSSGAVVLVIPPGVELPPREESPYAQPLSFRDLVFYQDGKEIPFIGSEVALKGDRPFSVEMPYGRLPEHLKTIMITLADSENKSQTFSFLLRVDEAKGAYSATIDSLHRYGAFPLLLQIFDYSERTISEVDGTLYATGTPQEQHGSSILGLLASYLRGGGYLWIAVVGVLMLVIMYLLLEVRRVRHGEKPKRYATS